MRACGVKGGCDCCARRSLAPPAPLSTCLWSQQDHSLASPLPRPEPKHPPPPLPTSGARLSTWRERSKVLTPSGVYERDKRGRRRADALSCKSPGTGGKKRGFTPFPSPATSKGKLRNFQMHDRMFRSGALFLLSQRGQADGSASHKAVRDPQFTALNS